MMGVMQALRRFGPRQARGQWTESVGSVNFCGRCISVLV